MTNKILVFLGAVFCFLIAFVSFAPEDRLRLVSVQYKRLINDPGQTCFDAHVNELIDQKSAEIIEANSYKFVTYVHYRAKNGFGTYKNDIFKCLDISILEDLESGKHVDERRVNEFKNEMHNDAEWDIVDRLDSVLKKSN